MKTFVQFALMILILCGTYTPLPAQFEGVVESRNLTVDETDKAQEFVMTMWITMGKMRIQNGAIGTTPPTTIIYRNDKGVFWVLNDEEKTYIEVLQNPEEGATPARPPTDEPNASSIKKTRKTKNILGYRCEQYMVKRPGEETVIWGTSRLSGLVNALKLLLGAEQQEAGESWNDELTRIGVFPLSAKVKVDGRVIESQEVTKIEKRSLPPELFELPDGFSRENVSGEMQPEK